MRDLPVSTFKHALLLMLILSMVFAGVAAWLVWGFDAGTAPALVPEAGNAESRVAKAPQKAAEDTGTGVAPRAPDGQLPDDPKAIVVAVGPEGLVGWDLQVRADGTMMTRQVGLEVKTFSLALVAGEVRGLLDYIVQEKLFFEMHEDHVDHEEL